MMAVIGQAAAVQLASRPQSSIPGIEEGRRSRLPLLSRVSSPTSHRTEMMCELLPN